jgi:hypothetical protein
MHFVGDCASGTSDEPIQQMFLSLAFSLIYWWYVERLSEIA